MELNKKNGQRILLLVACCVILYWALNNLSTLGRVLDSFLSLLSPLLLGICIAYVVNLLLKAIERLWDKALEKAPELWRVKLKRPICLALTMLLFLAEIEAQKSEIISKLEKGHDYCILGNHDFDYNDSVMAKNIIPTNLKWISSNYEFKNKELAKKFVKYDIKTVADKKIAFIGLNLNPIPPFLLIIRHFGKIRKGSIDK